MSLKCFRETYFKDSFIKQKKTFNQEYWVERRREEEGKEEEEEEEDG